MIDQATNPAGSGPQTFHDIAGRMGSIFGDLVGETPKDQTIPEAADMQEPVDQPTEEATDEFADDEDGEDGEGGEESAAADDKPTLHRVRANGEELEVTYDELIAGYSRLADYHKSKQAVAEEKRTVEAERAQLRAEREQYAAVLPQLKAVLQTSVGPAPDPGQYADWRQYEIARNTWQQANAQLQAIEAEQERVRRQGHEEQTAALKRYLDEQQSELVRKMPEWSNNEVAQREQREIADYLRGMGYRDDEIGQLYDHRAVLIARKAMLHDRLQAEGRKAATTGKKTAAPGNGQTMAEPRRVKEQRQKAFRTGKVEDIAPLFARAISRR